MASQANHSMFMSGLGTALPERRYTKAQCLAAFESSEWFARLGPRAHYIAKTVLQRDNGIEARRLAVDSLAEVFHIDADTLSQRFAAHAPRLAAAAGARALAAAHLDAAEVDAVVVSTCTGYLCPGLSGYVIESLNLRPDVQAFDLVGQGCAAALPNMMLGRALLLSGSCASVLSVCVEVSSAALYLDDDPGVLISACLFGDGAGAALLTRARRAPARAVEWRDSASSIDTGRRGALRFEQRAGLLRNVLTREVPELAAEQGGAVLATVLARAGVARQDIAAWILHAGGRDVLQAVARRWGLEREDLVCSAAVLREYGNLSSAFVYFVLEAALAEQAPGGWWWLASFGAGFACHGALLAVE